MNVILFHISPLSFNPKLDKFHALALVLCGNVLWEKSEICIFAVWNLEAAVFAWLGQRGAWRLWEMCSL